MCTFYVTENLHFTMIPYNIQTVNVLNILACQRLLCHITYPLPFWVAHTWYT